MSDTRTFNAEAEIALRKTIILMIRDACDKAKVPCHILVVAGITGDALVDSLAHKSALIGLDATILNISYEATRDFVVEDGWISFMTMFKGVPHNLKVNIGSVFQIFSPEQAGLTVVTPDTFAPDDFDESTLPPERRKPTLSIVK